MKRKTKERDYPIAKSAALQVDRVWLKTMPVRKPGVRSEKLVRNDRDSRG